MIEKGIDVKQLNRFAIYCWSVLVVNLFVILWGAYVRATGSGAGCGNHWPTCNGTAVPLTGQTETLIEFTHRLTSGFALLLVIGMAVWAYRAYPSGHRVRLGATLSMGFIIIEALIGAGLVLLELVALNDSGARAFVVGLHLINTFILLTTITLTAWWASGGQPIYWRGQGWVGRGLLAGYVGLLILGGSGAITALGDTLFPATTLAEGFRQDLSPTAHFLVQLRLYHPVVAIALGAYLILMAGMFNARRPTANTRKIGKILTVFYVVQLIGGALNVALLAPIWMQLVHLLMADILLIIFVLFVANAFHRPLVTSEASQPSLAKVGEQWLH